MKKKRVIAMCCAVTALLLWVILPAGGQAGGSPGCREKQEKREETEKKKTGVEKKETGADPRPMKVDDKNSPRSKNPRKKTKYIRSRGIEQEEKKGKKEPVKIQAAGNIRTAGKYTGEPGDFYFKDADLKNVLLMFARDYKFNIIIDPDVSGRVTCSLKQVPWDQALDLILRQNGMAMMRYGNVVSIVDLNTRSKKNEVKK